MSAERFVVLSSHDKSRRTDARSCPRLMTRSARLSTLRAASASVSRSSKAGWRLSRAPTSTMSRLRTCQLDVPYVEQPVLFLVGRENALTTTVKRVRRDLVPLCLPTEPNHPVTIRFRPGIPGRQEGCRLSAVGQAKLTGHPDDIAKVGRRLQRQ